MSQSKLSRETELLLNAMMRSKAPAGVPLRMNGYLRELMDNGLVESVGQTGDEIQFYVVKAVAPAEITRTVAIEHAGEKISVEVHIHLSQEEIHRVLIPALLKEMRAASGGVIG